MFEARQRSRKADHALGEIGVVEEVAHQHDVGLGRWTRREVSEEAVVIADAVGCGVQRRRTYMA